jgi:Fungal specific transcription factor domain
MYEAPLVYGGKAWLSSFIVQTKPLYNAVLSIAAYHQRSLLESDKSSKEEEETLHIMALNVLREDIKNLGQKTHTNGLKGGIKALACVVQLITFEVSICLAHKFLLC